MKKIGFVIPWYHKDIKGGAEQELRGIVKHLKEAGELRLRISHMFR